MPEAAGAGSPVAATAESDNPASWRPTPPTTDAAAVVPAARSKVRLEMEFRNVLLIDDDEDDQLMFKEVIESINPTLQCDTAPNGKTALDKLKVSTTLPDIIFLDLNMPIMNGYDFLLEIKKDSALNKIPVCIFTTSNILRDKELTKEFGAKSFLTKPNDFKLLSKQVRQILAADFSTNEYISII